MRKLFVLSMLLCSATVLPHSASAKEIKSSAAAEQLAKEKLPSASVAEVDTDYKNNELVYEVTMYKGKREYQLTYKASNAKLVKYEWDLETLQTSASGRQNLSKTKIKSLAKNKVKNATIKKITLDYDDHVPEYKIILKKGNKRYKLIYHAQTGKLLEYEWEIGHAKNSSSPYIGTDKAKTIALDKIPGATILRVEFDNDDGTPVYEVSLVKGNMEYDITIHAKTGKILDFDSDDID